MKIISAALFVFMISAASLMGFGICASFAEELVVRYPTPQSANDKRYLYPRELLELALKETIDSHGSYKIEDIYLEANKARLEIFLKHSQHIDITWQADNGILEKDFIPIRIPLLKGLIGYRVFLINRSDQGKFEKIKTIQDLRLLTAGFGHSWADRKILEANKISLETFPEYELIFKGLNKGRFDFFPRGINEAWNELESRKTVYPEMIVEKSILLYYPLPIYFITSKNNLGLAVRIEKGLLNAIENGRFEEVFRKYHEEILSNVNFEKRRLIELENPYLSPSTPKDEKFWFRRNIKNKTPG